MSMLPCKICPQCGFYHDKFQTVCNECGWDLQSVPLQILDRKEIPTDRVGRMDESIILFVQKCSVCGALNFSTDKEKPVQICYNCTKRRIASVSRKEYLPEEESKEVPEDNKAAGQEEQAASHGGNAENQHSGAGEEDDEEPGCWQVTLDKINKAVNGKKDQEMPDGLGGINQPGTGVEPVGFEEFGYGSGQRMEEIHDDFRDFGEWSQAPEGNILPDRGNQIRYSGDITFTSKQDGRISFTVEAGKGMIYILGRSANQKEFLESDLRVGNEHCVIMYKDGNWYVKDNDSKNGTLVNSVDIGEGGIRRLDSGDEITLGHMPDSPVFQIIIEKTGRKGL